MSRQANRVLDFLLSLPNLLPLIYSFSVNGTIVCPVTQTKTRGVILHSSLFSFFTPNPSAKWHYVKTVSLIRPLVNISTIST